jgi:hypothetical protein
MMRAGIDLRRHRKARGLRSLGKPAARLGGSPVVLLAAENEERRARLVDARSIGAPVAVARVASRVERDCRREPGLLRRGQRRDHRRERRRSAVRAAHHADVRAVDVGQRAGIGERVVRIARAAIGAHLLAARRRIHAHAFGMAARGEAVGDEHDVALCDERRGPARGSAARSRAEPAAIVEDDDGGEGARAIGPGDLDRNRCGGRVVHQCGHGSIGCGRCATGRNEAAHEQVSNVHGAQSRYFGNFGIAAKSAGSCWTTKRACVLATIFSMRSNDASVSARLSLPGGTRRCARFSRR